MVITSPLIVSCRFVYKLTKKSPPMFPRCLCLLSFFTLYSLVQLSSFPLLFSPLSQKVFNSEHKSSSFIYYYIRRLFNIRPLCFCPPLDIHLLPPSPGDSTVSVGERVPGAGLLPPPYGPGGAFLVARPDDALPLGQHHRPREAGSVSPGIRHWPQVSLRIYFTMMSEVKEDNISVLSVCACVLWHSDFFSPLSSGDNAKFKMIWRAVFRGWKR